MGRRLFQERITPFLREKLERLALAHGEASPQYRALARQYVRSPGEDIQTEESNLRHYEADIGLEADHTRLPGIERLYRRTLAIEPTLACVAHCRYCIRANYPRHNLTDEQLIAVARFCGNRENRDDLREVLVTGGDVLIVPDRVDALVTALIRYAPNIRIIRIATRIPVQEPRRIDDRVLRIFRNPGAPRFELATQINHRVELFPEVVEAYRKIMDTGTVVYAQNVMLRGVNDNVDSLVDLYDELRLLGIESHYLFHCVPLTGMNHLRTTLDETVRLARALTCSGRISGRAKPMVAAMTDIGKIVLYDGAILDRVDRRVLLQSDYTMAERLRWNPRWKAPENVQVDANGQLRIWYLDGTPPAKTAPESQRQAPSPRAEAGAALSLPVMPAHA